MSPVFDVSGAVGVLNQSLAYAYPEIIVVGELAHFKIAKNRWVYADLKDESAKLRVFGSVFSLSGSLEEGMMVQVVAEPRVHPQFGFSLNLKSIKPVGEGSLKKAADLLKRKLEAEGLFAQERKKTVPLAPERIGLITSGQSAAYADFVKILNARWRGVEVLLYDVQVQGQTAVDEIVTALTHFNQASVPVDAVVMIRGGGGADDLAAFNTERVTRAVAASRIASVVAIGHEVDVSLAELAADLHASTPSNAAELLFPDRGNISKQLELTQKSLDELAKGWLNVKALGLEEARTSLVGMVENVVEQKKQELKHAHVLLNSVHPRSTLRRGYALVQAGGKLVSSKSQLSKGAQVQLTFKDGAVGAVVDDV